MAEHKQSVQKEAPKRNAPAKCLSPAVRAAADLLFVFYLALLLRLTVFRNDFSWDNFMLGGQLNLVLFRQLINVIRTGGAYYFFRLFLGNIAAFLPFGAYLAFRTKRPLAVILLFGALLSAAVEALQFMFDVGFTEIDDIILNALGTLLGAAAVRMLAKSGKGTHKKA